MKTRSKISQVIVVLADGRRQVFTGEDLSAVAKFVNCVDKFLESLRFRASLTNQPGDEDEDEESGVA